MLRKKVYTCEKFNKTSLPGKKEFYSSFNMENIINADYMHSKKYENTKCVEIYELDRDDFF